MLDQGQSLLHAEAKIAVPFVIRTLVPVLRSIESSPDGALATCQSGNEVVLYPIEGGGQPTVIELGGRVEFVNWQRVAN